MTFSVYEYSNNTTPVSWFAPHRQSLYTHWEALSAIVQTIISMGWMNGTWDFIPTAPFRVVHSAAIPKPRKPSKCRKIWTASIPGPEMEKRAVDNGANHELSVESNANAFLPPYLVMDCISIERICLSINFLACIRFKTGENIQGRNCHFSHWFKMFDMAVPEHWKACIFFTNKFYLNVQAQMRRVAGANIGQRPSFLLASVAMRADTQ